MSKEGTKCCAARSKRLRPKGPVRDFITRFSLQFNSTKKQHTLSVNLVREGSTNERHCQVAGEV